MKTTMVYVAFHLVCDVKSYNDSIDSNINNSVHRLSLEYDVESYNYDFMNNENNNGLRRLPPSIWCRELQWFSEQLKQQWSTPTFTYIVYLM